jgi:hypothetical protein
MMSSIALQIVVDLFAIWGVIAAFGVVMLIVGMRKGAEEERLALEAESESVRVASEKARREGVYYVAAVHDGVAVIDGRGGDGTPAFWCVSQEAGDVLAASLNQARQKYDRR